MLDTIPATIDVTYRAAITRRGAATLRLYRLIDALRELDAADRAYVLAMLKEELTDLPPVA